MVNQTKVLLKERQRIEDIEHQIMEQQRQWSDMWLKSRQEDNKAAAVQAAVAEENAQKIIQSVEKIAEADTGAGGGGGDASPNG